MTELSRQRALLVEDDHDLVEVVETIAKQLGYELDHAADGEQGIEMALANAYGFVVLDLNLPGLDGVEVCKRLRAENTRIPILMLTSNADELNKILLLELGADDYITKPFSIRELKARIGTVLRRTKASSEVVGDEPFAVGEFVLDTGARKITIDEKEVSVTPQEFDILQVLISRPGFVFSRNALLRQVHGYDCPSYERGLNTHITRIRAKIEKDPSNPRFLLTVRGVGYRFATEEELSSD